MNCRGMALVGGLVLLTSVALLAVTAAGSMTLQLHQAANFADKQRAAEDAALAESYAVAWLYSRGNTERQTGCSSNCLLPAGIHREEDLPDYPELGSMAWWQSNGTAAGSHPLSGEPLGYSSSGPLDSLWVMQEIHFQPSEQNSGDETFDGVGFYRIFSRGRGVHPGSVTVFEAIVARPWGKSVEREDFPPGAPLFEFCHQFPVDLPCGIQSWRLRR